jgi:hypothetical protein
MLYKENSGVVTVYWFIAPPRSPLLHPLCALELLYSPRAATSVDARKDPCAQEQDGKSKSTNASTNWVPSEFAQTDLTKAQKDGFITAGDQVVFPSIDRIPKPPSGYQVMLLAFLLRGLSFPAHEFLCGFLFVYGVQLHQLTPNSILHNACFVHLCESFLGIEPHWILWKFLFRLRPSVALSKKPELGGAVVSVRSELHYLEFNMLPQCKVGGKIGFTSKIRKTPPLTNMALLLLMPIRS